MRWGLLLIGRGVGFLGKGILLWCWWVCLVSRRFALELRRLFEIYMEYAAVNTCRLSYKSLGKMKQCIYYTLPNNWLRNNNGILILF